MPYKDKDSKRLIDSFDITIFAKTVQMITLYEIQAIANANDETKLKEYYNRCIDNLRELSKRSNQLSVFLLLLISIGFFSSDISEITTMGFKINSKDAIVILTPVLSSYFIFEWCIIARRRRDLMRVIKHLGFELFNQKPADREFEIMNFSPQSRNAMPFSFMIEVLNIEKTNKFGALLTSIFLFIIFSVMPFFLIYSIWQ